MKSEKPTVKVGQPVKDGTRADAQIQLRTTLRRKAAYVRAARPGKLTDWIFKHLDRAAKYRRRKGEAHINKRRSSPDCEDSAQQTEEMKTTIKKEGRVWTWAVGGCGGYGKTKRDAVNDASLMKAQLTPLANAPKANPTTPAR